VSEIAAQAAQIDDQKDDMISDSVRLSANRLTTDILGARFHTGRQLGPGSTPHQALILSALSINSASEFACISATI
jgi:hypothetical protein